MKKIWNVISSIKTKSSVKTKLFLLSLITLNIVIGAGLWLLAGRMIFPEKEWIICFMGYPAIFIGCFGGILYLYNNEFN